MCVCVCERERERERLMHVVGGILIFLCINDGQFSLFVVKFLLSSFLVSMPPFLFFGEIRVSGSGSLILYTLPHHLTFFSLQKLCCEFVSEEKRNLTVHRLSFKRGMNWGGSYTT